MYITWIKASRGLWTGGKMSQQPNVLHRILLVNYSAKLFFFVYDHEILLDTSSFLTSRKDARHLANINVYFGIYCVLFYLPVWFLLLLFVILASSFSLAVHSSSRATLPSLPANTSDKFFTTVMKTSQNVSKLSHQFTDYKKCIDSFIYRLLQSQIAVLDQRLKSTVVAEDFRPMATVAKVWSHSYGHR